MGCDIHAIAQRRVGDAWETVDPPEDLIDDYGDMPYEDRNYALFGVLAGVRNYDVEPIAEPRGLPEDLEIGPSTRLWTDWQDGWEDSPPGWKWLGDHSYSWLSAAELAAYDWSQSADSWGPIGEQVALDRWLPWLLSLAEDPKDVRLVFGFDS